MIATIQVDKCDVRIDSQLQSSIGVGMLVLLGIEKYDSIVDIKYLTNKIIKLRIFNDNNDKMNLSIIDIRGAIMVVSQFTLCANLDKGHRPSYVNAMEPQGAEKLYNQFINYMKKKYHDIQEGVFRANMQINLINNGPVTIILRSQNANT